MSNPEDLRKDRSKHQYSLTTIRIVEAWTGVVSLAIGTDIALDRVTDVAQPAGVVYAQGILAICFAASSRVANSQARITEARIIDLDRQIARSVDDAPTASSQVG